MVAYTSPDCLPYYESGDSVCLNTGTLCEPSTVFCDMAELVEAKLDGFDALVARIGTSTPLAWVTRDTVQRVSTEFKVPFTAAVVDTDNMVNLDIDPYIIHINTTGLYQVFFTFRGLSTIGVPGDVVNVAAFFSVSSANPYPGIGAAVSNVYFSNAASNATNQYLSISASVMWPFTAGQSISLSSAQESGTAGDGAVWSAIALGVAWMGELP